MAAAVVVGGPGEIGLEERPAPAPGEGEALVRVGLACICHTDHYILAGGHPAVRYPIVPGHEVSATVVAIGAGVRSVRPGDRVAIQTQLSCHRCPACADGRPADCPDVRQVGSTQDGGWQDLLVLPQDALYPIGGLSLAEAALIEPAANGHAAVRSARVAEGDVVVVIGPGAIGLMALMMARLERPRRTIVVGRAVDERRLELARSLGADDVVGTDERAVEAVMELTGGAGADAVIQCAGSVQATVTALAVAGRRGRVVIEGYAGRPGTISLSPDRLAVEQITLTGVNGWALADFEAALAHARARRLDLGALITHRYPLGDHAAAIARSQDYAGGAVRVAFQVDPCA
jgi:L-iditol 2-dehydrogenase